MAFTPMSLHEHVFENYIERCFHILILGHQRVIGGHYVVNRDRVTN